MGLTLLYAGHEVGAGVAGGGAEGVGDRAGHDDGLLDEQRCPPR
jgi:hypothetical protein